MSKNTFGLSSSLRRDLIARFTSPEQTEKSAAGAFSEHDLANPVSVPDKFYRFEHFEEYQKLLIPQVTAKRLGVENPFFKVHEGNAGATTVINGRKLINFSNYNYLGLCGDSRVNEAAINAIHRYGTSASASRLVAGERPIHRDLEMAFAKLYEVDDCAVFVSGHATNVTTIGCLFGPKDLILHDALIHNSILEGIRLSGAMRRSFPHNDFEALRSILAEIRSQFQRVLIVIEGLYSMDGDISDLPRFIEIKNQYKTFLMVDEAHSLGVLGAHGKGISEHYGVPGKAVDIWMGTLSKTLAGCGGYIAGSKALVELLKFTASGFVYSVGMSPPLAAASLEALRILQEEPERVKRLHERASQFLALAQQHGMPTGHSQGFAITPIITQNSLKAVTLSHRLLERGINVQPIIYPAVEERSARLRFFLSSEHTEEQIQQAIDTLVDLL